MPRKPSVDSAEPGSSWQNRILRCLVDKKSPILFPVQPERWNETHAIAMRLVPDALVLCVRHEKGSFQVLHDESIWDTEQEYFAICSIPEDTDTTQT